MYLGRNPPTYRQAQRYRVNRAGALGELGAAFQTGRSAGRPGMFGVTRSSEGPTETANRYEGSACPPGQTVVNRETRQHAPKFAGGPTRTDYVYCRPATSAGPAAAPAARTEISPTITVSPTFQQAFTPQVSPVFQQTQDSPGATQAATPVQSAPGGQEATGGGSGGDSSGLLEFMREMEAARAQEREEERRRQAELEERRRQEAAAEADRRAREEAARQKAAAAAEAAAAEAEAARQAELEELQRQTRQPQQTIYQPGAAPRAPTGAPATATAQSVEEGGGVPLIAIVGAGAAIALLAFMGSKPKKRKR